MVTWNDRSLIVVGVTKRNTLFAHFLGQAVGVELDLASDEYEVIPDLLHPITAGVLFERWAREACYASIQADRFRLVGPRPERSTRVRTMTGAWALIVDTGSQLMVYSDDDLGVVSAEALLALWRRLDRMTPSRLRAITRNLRAPDEEADDES